MVVVRIGVYINFFFSFSASKGLLDIKGFACSSVRSYLDVAYFFVLLPSSLRCSSSPSSLCEDSPDPLLLVESFSSPHCSPAVRMHPVHDVQRHIEHLLPADLALLFSVAVTHHLVQVLHELGLQDALLSRTQRLPGSPQDGLQLVRPRHCPQNWRAQKEEHSENCCSLHVWAVALFTLVT